MDRTPPQAPYHEGNDTTAGNGGKVLAEQQARLANTAELTSVIAHEFNNFLNGILLHVALLEQQAPPELHGQLEVIRKLGNNAATMVKRLQTFLRKDRAPLQPVDLNQALRDVLANTPVSVPVHQTLAPQLPPVVGNMNELHRLIEMLVTNACAAVAPRGGNVDVRTEAQACKVLLQVSDTGPAIAPDLLNQVFDPFVIARPGIAEPGLAVSKALARRLQATVRVENRPQGGVTFTVEFTPSTGHE